MVALLASLVARSRTAVVVVLKFQITTVELRENVSDGNAVLQKQKYRNGHMYAHSHEHTPDCYRFGLRLRQE